jgi:LysR family transcriptional regulator, regulator for bpeEF and oprC
MASLLARLQGIEEFIAVAETGSFVRASEALGVTSSGVGKTVGRLEQRLRTRLFNRTTRKVSLTEDGQAFLVRCKSALADLAEAEVALDQSRSEPEGLLRVDMPVAYGRLVVMPLLARFRLAYPKVQLKLQLSDRLSDLVEDRLDVVFRIGQLADSSVVAAPFDRVRFGAFAHPSYLKSLGKVTDPAALRKAELLTFTLNSGRPLQLRFQRGDSDAVLSPGKGLVSNDIEAVMEAAAHGMGIAFLPTFLQRSARAKSLVPVLPDWRVDGPPIHIVYPSARHLSRRVRAFVDFSLEHRAEATSIEG